MNNKHEVIVRALSYYKSPFSHDEIIDRLKKEFNLSDAEIKELGRLLIPYKKHFDRLEQQNRREVE